ncbi:hypothetical protein AAZX31_10G062900 [Glycine max]|uniref:peptidyl-prolyl cis-trans isomerase FKBP17-1, chloroplastic isoform X1 n=1 Tax=Glycine max TaxID=3847 RepID=UPI001B356F2E|nr:peptidyl-prolyl cis-trans isomerase FKBP17-1, chloroplastic isoform X1 [Glycine max]
MKTIIERCVSASATRICAPLSYTKYPCNNINMFATCSASSSSTTRRPLSLSLISTTFSAFIFSLPPPAPSSSSPFPSSKFPVSKFFEIPNSGGVKALELLDGSGEVPSDGDQVAIHYYGRLAAKQGWRFDSTYDHKDNNGDPNPFVFVLGSGKVIAGIDVAVRSMKVGGIRRVIIPPSLGYQNTSQEPIPPNVRSFFFSRLIACLCFYTIGGIRRVIIPLSLSLHTLLLFLSANISY